MTRDEFEKLENGDPVEFNEIAKTVRGEVIRGRRFLRIDWESGDSTAHHASNDTSEAWLMNLSRLPRPLTANEQLLVEALNGLLDTEPCRYDHNDFCQEHYCSRPCKAEVARAAIAKVTGGGA